MARGQLLTITGMLLITLLPSTYQMINWAPMNPVYRILTYLGVVIGFATGWLVFGIGFAKWWWSINEEGGAN